MLVLSFFNSKLSLAPSLSEFVFGPDSFEVLPSFLDAIECFAALDFELDTDDPIHRSSSVDVISSVSLISRLTDVPVGHPGCHGCNCN